MTSELLEVGGVPFSGAKLETEHASILLIRGKKAHLGCGSFSLAPADRLGDRFAIVTGVKCFADMLQARVVAVSVAAAACGVAEGMTGRDALLLMERA